MERWLGRATLVLLAVLAVMVAFYLAYRWAAHNRERLVGWGKRCLPILPWRACGRATTPSCGGCSVA